MTSHALHTLVVGLWWLAAVAAFDGSVRHQRARGSAWPWVLAPQLLLSTWILYMSSVRLAGWITDASYLAAVRPLAPVLYLSLASLLLVVRLRTRRTEKRDELMEAAADHVKKKLG